MLLLFRILNVARVIVTALFLLSFLGGITWYYLVGPNETCSTSTDRSGVWKICRIH